MRESLINALKLAPPQTTLGSTSITLPSVFPASRNAPLARQTTPAPLA